MTYIICTVSKWLRVSTLPACTLESNSTAKCNTLFIAVLCDLGRCLYFFLQLADDYKVGAHEFSPVL